MYDPNLSSLKKYLHLGSGKVRTFSWSRYSIWLCHLGCVEMCGVPPTPTIVPGAPPQNVTGEAVGPTSIRVSWNPPPAERSNGHIMYYKLLVVESGRSDSEAAMITLNATSFVLDELKRWTEYRIWVLAGTSIGDGPSSFPITVRTHEDGTYFIKNNTPRAEGCGVGREREF